MTAAQASRTPATGKSAERVEIAIRPGVTTPDWSVVTSETVREALGAIFMPLLAAASVNPERKPT